MFDNITQIQDRISDIQSRIDEISSGLKAVGGTGAVAGATPSSPTFAQTLAQQARAAEADALASTDSLTPDPTANPSLDVPSADPLLGLGAGTVPGQPGTVLANPATWGGRLPYVPPAPPLPPAATGVAPFAPPLGQIMPIKKSSRLDSYTPYIQRYAYQNGLSPALVRAVIQTESGGDTHAVSTAGAMGLMQLMPDNVREAGISDPFDPEQNIAAGTKQLASLLNQYKGDLDMALAGYNAGPGNVHKYGGVPPFPETRNYIRKVRAAMGDV
jgi:hypothetical protein